MGVHVQLTHEQVKCLSSQDVKKHCKRYKMYVDARNTESFIESFLMLVTNAVGSFVHLKDTNALQQKISLFTKYIFSKKKTQCQINLQKRNLQLNK